MKKTKNSAIRITVYCLLIVFVIAIINLQINMSELNDTIDEQDEEILNLRDDIAAYEIRLTEEKDADYYERLARILGYHYPNEIIFINDYGK